jgi:hypothetical protein
MREMKGYTSTRYLRWRRSCQHLSTNLLVLFPKQKTSIEEEDKGNIDDAGPSNTRTSKEEPRDLRGRKNIAKREAGGETYALK